MNHPRYTQVFFEILHELHNLRDEIDDDNAVMQMRIQRLFNSIHELDRILNTT